MFGEVLKKIIDESELSLVKVSRVSGISRSMLYKVIKGDSGMSNEKFTQLINSALFNNIQMEELMESYILTSTANGDGKGVIRALNFVENIQNNYSRKKSPPIELIKSQSYQMFFERKQIENILSYSLANYQKEVLILVQEMSRIEKHIPEKGDNIILLKNISDLSQKVHNLNDGLLACLRNPDLEFYYTSNPTLNISIYDNYILADDVLLMYDCDLSQLAYTSSSSRISFFKRIFFERLDSANRYFKLEQLPKNYEEVLQINENQSIIVKENQYMIKNGSRVLVLDKMLEQDLSDYFAKGAHNVKIHQ